MMATQPVPRPVTGCQTCQQQYAGLKLLYQMWANVPGDPGVQGVFEAAREEYEKHVESHDLDAQLLTAAQAAYADVVKLVERHKAAQQLLEDWMSYVNFGFSCNWQNTTYLLPRYQDLGKRTKALLPKNKESEEAASCSPDK